MLVVLPEAAKERNLRRGGCACASARPRLRPSLHGCRSENSRLGFVRNFRKVAPEPERWKCAEGFKEMPSFTAKSWWVDHSSKGGGGSGAERVQSIEAMLAAAGYGDSGFTDADYLALAPGEDPNYLSGCKGSPGDPDKAVDGASGSPSKFTMGKTHFYIEGGSPEQQQEAQTGIRRIMGSPGRGKAMMDVLDARGDSDFYVGLRRGIGSQSYSNSQGIVLDVDQIGTPYESNSGKRPFTITRMEAHELGHAIFGTRDLGLNNMENIWQNENPIMRALGDPYDRIKY